ncbi:MAG: M1 family aminopeptidase [Bacteroidetes bacterium]|nr:M1 family aminopeptidase [Bacteroidota bacterium]
MKKIATLLFSLIAVISANSQTQTNVPVQTQAQNSISDTIDILHYTVKLNITDFTTDTIRGGTIIKFTPKINNVNILPLDLLHMRIDSIVENNTLLTYTYSDTLLKINLPASMNIGDTANLAVWYHGKPQLDPGPNVWGGFYFQAPYAYNLGVSFNANPHAFGRVFHPCFDNFVERASYTFVIGTNNGHTSYCNGVLGADTIDLNSIRWRTWNLTETIPSYLASISTATYTQVNWTHTGIYGSYPIILTALPSDTTNLKNSFVHLNDALAAFETRFGPYEWPRVGYCLVPFSSGAMEHATNISYPRVCANGSLTYEASIMAHELSHHWFGDLATCNNEGEMWLNEGWASYAEYVFTEWEYGHTAYKNGIRTNHDEMVHLVHLREGGYLPLNTIPHAYTYGDNVYLRGADVAHTLRGYMGDSLFWIGIHHYLANRQYTDVTSVQFRDDLIAATGLTYLNDFFNDWVFNAGWPHFSIDSTVSVPNGPNYDVTVYVRQKLTGATNYFTNIPLDFTFLKSDWSKTTSRQFISGQYTSFIVTLPFNPAMTAIDMDEKISDAIVDEAGTISTIGAHNFTTARCSLTVISIVDSAFVRVEHNYAKPDPIINNTNNYRISDQRYWTIDGIFPTTFIAKARLYYDGRTSTTAGPGNYLDDHLTTPNGDSIILLYRRNPADDWHEYPHHYIKSIVGPHATSKYGYVEADTLMKGQYCFANGVSHMLIGVEELPPLPSEIFAYPNPAGNSVTVEWDENSNEPVLVNIYDGEGKLTFTKTMTGALAKLETSRWMDGLYTVEVIQQGKLLGRKKVMIIH